MNLQESREQLFKHLSWEIQDRHVIEAMKRVPRERFVPPELRDAAYEDHPLSIGFGQTISQPFIVAAMLQALELKRTDSVLEVGTGSGYVAAILGELAATVVSVEIVPELADSARTTVSALGYTNVQIHLVSRSSLGWMPDAPYDAIIVSAGAPSVPQVLLGQLKWNGRMVIPIGTRWQQHLVKITRTPEGDLVDDLGACFFVPLLGEGAWNG